MRTLSRFAFAAVALLMLVGADSKPPRQVKLLIPEKTFKTEGSKKTLRVTFDDLLKVLNMDPVTADAPEHMPAWLKNLDRKRIRIRGYIYTPFNEKGLEEFTFVADEDVVTFGRLPEVYDAIPVKLKKGTTADYNGLKPIDIEGVFRIEPKELEAELVQVYSLDDAVIVRK